MRENAILKDSCGGTQPLFGLLKGLLHPLRRLCFGHRSFLRCIVHELAAANCQEAKGLLDVSLGVKRGSARDAVKAFDVCDNVADFGPCRGPSSQGREDDPGGIVCLRSPDVGLGAMFLLKGTTKVPDSRVLAIGVVGGSREDGPFRRAPRLLKYLRVVETVGAEDGSVDPQFLLLPQDRD